MRAFHGKLETGLAACAGARRGLISAPGVPRRAIAAAAGLLFAVAGGSIARAFDVSGLHFNDLHIGSSSPPPAHNYQPRNNAPVQPPPPRETWHAFTPEDLARQHAENVVRFRQALALMKPVPAVGGAEASAPSTPWGDMTALTLGGTVLMVGIPLVDLMAKVMPASPPPPATPVPKFGREAENPPRSGPLVRIGGVGAARGDIYMVVPGGQKRIRLTPGKPVYHNCRLSTGPNAHVQILLADETVFTMGPDSDLVLDDFVYDPDTSVGKVTARLTKGVFRFVSGKVARQGPSNMKVVVPAGAIGIRGTEFEVALDDGSGHGRIKLYYGKLEIAENKTGGTFEMNSGQKVDFSSDGDFGQPEPLDAAASRRELDAAGRALYLLRAAAALNGEDDKEFLAEQAGFALSQGAVPVEVPAAAEAAGDDAQKFLSLETDLEVKTAAWAHFERLRRSLEEDKADATEAAAGEEAAKAALQAARDARQAMIENRAYTPAPQSPLDELQ